MLCCRYYHLWTIRNYDPQERGGDHEIIQKMRKKCGEDKLLQKVANEQA